MYEVIDSRTGQRVGGPYKTMARALNRADELDLVYGAVRYRVQRVKAA